jgi:ferrous iron transport protein A
MTNTTSSTTQTIPLADLRVGQEAEVVALELTGADRRRMLDLGILQGTRLIAEMRSPLGDPVAYRVRGALIALRQAQARQIIVQLIDDASTKEAK